jgi:3-oxoacyl-[acyl-carrier-protein] synthase-3
MTMRAVLAGVGAYLPREAVTNDMLAQRVETSDEWIRSRTGIGERRLAQPDETCAMMATEAARAALANAGMGAGEVDAVILATSTPDQAFPATALRVQAALGMTRGFGFDISAACSGFVYALSVADGMIRSGAQRAGDRRGGVLAHSGLGGSHNLRVVRRWRGGGAAARGG